MYFKSLTPGGYLGLKLRKLTLNFQAKKTFLTNKSLAEMNGLIDGEYPDEIEMLDGIVPTIPANHIYPPVPFAPIDSALTLATRNTAILHLSL